MDIGKRIVRLRELKGWSQREIADRLKINVSVMNRIESGERPARDQEIANIAMVLGTTSDDLLGIEMSKDEKDIAKRLEELKKDLTSAYDLKFSGEPMSEDAKESLIEGMDHLFRQTQRINKKYISNKHRKDED